MRLRRSNARGNEQITPDRRPFRWLRRIFVLMLIGLIVGGWSIVSSSYLTADGLIDGQIIQVSALSSGRVLETYATCNETVEMRDPMARVENDARALSYVARLGELREQSAQASFNLDLLLLEVEAAAARVEEQRAFVAERRANWEAHNRLYEQGVVTRVSWSQARSELARAEAQLLTAETLLRNRQAEFDSAQTLALSQTDSVVQQLNFLDTADELRGEVVVAAPRAGIVITCEAEVGEVTLAGATMFEIFDPATATARAFISENDIARVAIGDEMELQLAGYPERMTAQVRSIDPSFTDLPEEFRRFFWHDPSWGRYAVVELSLQEMDVVRERIRLGGRLTVRRVELSETVRSIRRIIGSVVGGVSLFGYELVPAVPASVPGEDT